ncbi:uncharacterized protein LOC106869459 [Octopus bimaculoides]|uniref:uncharacterized protein LOC106869459 n=1 Tax=Octopus bimaculoides TaxID=37653 RepID=UPI00071CF6AE|nr:uncharacterized protein LOC106869459 [Octopus bimaculoides]|eukprot:XP_014770695.1 PREDICTED: uncharacterized protein LOC106869459 [Octopus bimaculoides]
MDNISEDEVEKAIKKLKNNKAAGADNITAELLKHGFDSAHRESPWKIASLYGVLQKFIAIIQNIYKNSSCCIKMQEGNTEYFAIKTGVRQVCIMSPFLFLLAVDFIVKKAIDGKNLGIQWQQQQQQQNQQQQQLVDLHFADDIELLEESREGLQQLTTNLAETAGKISLRISHEKTKVMQVWVEDKQSNVKITVGNQQVEDVTSFSYLGSVLASDGGADSNVKVRVGKAAAVFRKMGKIWASKSIDLEIKLRLFSTIVLPTALYVNETWKVTSTISNKMDVFHQRCLRKILKISYRDHITNTAVLQRAQSRRLQDIVAERRMRLTGHIFRMPDQWHAKTAFRWEPPNGKRKRGRPKTTWRRSFKADIAVINRK